VEVRQQIFVDLKEKVVNFRYESGNILSIGVVEQDSPWPPAFLILVPRSL